ncbi:hypothetical protein H4R33_001486 [Dimargaris cristalligena]|nr:hypothetical protein H4R33_001486 [Dimargaris cristalligena]
MGIATATIPKTPRAVTPMDKGALGRLYTQSPVASQNSLNHRGYPNYTPEHRRRAAFSAIPCESLVKRTPIPMPNPKPSDSNSAALTLSKVPNSSGGTINRHYPVEFGSTNTKDIKFALIF